MRTRVISWLALTSLPLAAPALVQAESLPSTEEVPLMAAVTLRPDHQPRKESMLPRAPSIAVGFSAEPRLRDAVRKALLHGRHYHLSSTPQLPPQPGSLFIGGLLVDMHHQDGWVDCRVHYGVAGQPDGSIRFASTVAASIPVLPSRIFAGAPELVDVAETSCLDEIARQISEQVSPLFSSLPGPTGNCRLDGANEKNAQKWVPTSPLDK